MLLFRAPRIFLTMPVFLLLATLRPSSVSFAGEIWDGGGADADWTTGNNWDAVGLGRLQFPPPNNGTANVHFAGNDNTIPNVDVPYSINSLTFDAGSVSFFITGQELTVGAGGVTNNDNSSQLVLAPMRLAASQTWNAAAGPLSLGPVNLNGRVATIAGGFNVLLTNAISGAGGIAIDPAYLATVTMQGNAGTSNTYTGATTVNGGTLVLQKTGGATAIAGDLIVTGGGTARLLASEQVSDAASSTIQVSSFGVFDLNGFNETASYLSLVFNGSVTTGTGVMKVLDYFVAGSNSMFTGKLALGDVEAHVQSDAQVTSTIDLVIGETSRGTLLISTGADVSNVNGDIGLQEGSMGMVTVIGNSSTWNNSGNLLVGVNGEASLNIYTAGAVNVGHDVRINAASTVDIDGGTLDIANDIDIAGDLTAFGGRLEFNNGVVRSGGKLDVEGSIFSHPGMLDLESGATLIVQGAPINYQPHFVRVGTTSGAAAEMSVRGLAARVTSDFAIDVGYGGAGVMSVQLGAEVYSSTGAVGSFNAGSVGTLNLIGRGADGEPSKWVLTSGLNMGLDAASQGTINITGGALLQSPFLAVGTPGTGHVFVDGVESPGSPSHLVLTDLSIGQGGGGNGTGFVTASHGGRIDVSGIGIGYLGGVGSLTVTDPGSTLVQPATGYLTLGHATAGMGSVNVLEGGVYTSGTGLIDVQARGAMTISGVAAQGRFNANGPMTVRGSVTVGDALAGVGGFLDVNAGLTINGGTVLLKRGVIDANAITQTGGGVLDMQGGVLHVDAFTGNLVNDAGTLAPGHSIGASTITGSYAQHENANFEIEIGGVALGQWDTLAVGGNAALNGALEVKFVDGFEPVLGNSFTIITTNAGNVGGAFSQLILPLVNGVSFDVVYNPKNVMLVARPGFTADFDDDGDVDGGDLAHWQRDFAETAASDADADGDSDGADFLAWQRQFGAAAGVAVSAKVPEPQGFLLAWLAAAAATARRCRDCC